MRYNFSDRIEKRSFRCKMLKHYTKMTAREWRVESRPAEHFFAPKARS